MDPHRSAGPPNAQQARLPSMIHLGRIDEDEFDFGYTDDEWELNNDDDVWGSSDGDY